MNKKIVQIDFSPSGTTQKLASSFAHAIDSNPTHIDLLKNPLAEDLSFDSDTLLVVAMPVFAGRIPAICVPMLNHLKGNKTPTIALVSFGNRAYDDALLELCDLLEQNDCVILGGGAFVAQHSIFTSVANGRPNQEDMISTQDFAHKCIAKLEATEKLETILPSISGNRPYIEAKAIPLKPKGSASCNSCGICAKICPVNAINPQNPRKTEKEKCITCTACISHCPNNARSLNSIIYKVASKSFSKDNAIPLKPEIFL